MSGEDTMELGEMLTLLGDWLEGADQPQLAASFARFIDTDGYDLHDLRTDLARLAFLLGADDGTRLFGSHHP